MKKFDIAVTGKRQETGVFTIEAQSRKQAKIKAYEAVYMQTVIPDNGKTLTDDSIEINLTIPTKKENGWTIQFKWLADLVDRCREVDDESYSMETAEGILLELHRMSLAACGGGK